VFIVVEAASAVAEIMGISKYSVSIISFPFSGLLEESILDVLIGWSNTSGKVVVVGEESSMGRCEDSNVVAL